MSRTRLVTIVAVTNGIGYAVGSALDPITELFPALLFGATVVTFSAVGAILTIRVPTNRIGPLLLTAATIQAAAAVLGAYGDVGMASTPVLAGAVVATILASSLFLFPIVIALVAIPLIFPNGHLPSRRFRWIVWLTVAAMIGSTIYDLFGATSVGAAGMDNPFAIPALAPLLGVVETLVTLSSVVGFGGAAAAVWVRFHRGEPIVREQTKWLLAVAGAAAIAFPLAFIVSDVSPELANLFFVVGVLTMVALPIAIGIAVLRYRLYDIDRIVSRTIAYAVVTGMLVVTFAVVVVVLSTALSGIAAASGQTIAVAASTLVVFALFQPVMGRIRRSVDRRFDRARYDAERTTAAFSDRLHHEVDLATVTTDLTGTTMAALAPTRLGIWIRGSRND